LRGRRERLDDFVPVIRLNTVDLDDPRDERLPLR
jgi:hypothetical protein